MNSILPPYHLKDVHIDSITVPESRSRIDLGSLTPLADDISRRGIISPICLEQDGEALTLLAGERRLRATLLAISQHPHLKDQLSLLPSKIYSGPLTKTDRLLIELNENILRKDLTPDEKAAHTKRIHLLAQEKFGRARPGKKVGHSIEDTARLTQLSPSTVSRHISIATFVEENPDLAPLIKETSSLNDLESLKNEKVKLEAVTELRKRTTSRAEESHLAQLTTLRNALKNRLSLNRPRSITTTFDLIILHEEPDDLDSLPLNPNSWILSYFPLPNSYPAYHYHSNNALSHSPSTVLSPSITPFYYIPNNLPLLSKPGRSNVFKYSTELAFYQEVFRTFLQARSSIYLPSTPTFKPILAANNLSHQVLAYTTNPDLKHSFDQTVESGNGTYYYDY